MAPWRRVRIPAVVLPRRPNLDLRALAPSPRSVAAGLVLIPIAAAAYIGARETSVFAVRQVDIVGASPAVRAQVRIALRPVVGRSLLEVDADVLDRRISDVPQVASIRFDRAFPHTLTVHVTPEQPVLLLRQGRVGWVVSARGRVIRRVKTTRLSSLPRVWVPRGEKVVVGATLPARAGGFAAALFAPLAEARLPARVRFVRAGEKELTLVLRSRMEVRLGNADDLRLKLAIARRILLASGALPGGYLDVSVPERPVVLPSESQVAS